MKQEVLQTFWVLWQPASVEVNGPAYSSGSAFCRGWVGHSNDLQQINNSPWVIDWDEEYGDNDGSVACCTFTNFEAAYEAGLKLSQSGLPNSYYVPVQIETVRQSSESTRPADVYGLNHAKENS